MPSPFGALVARVVSDLIDALPTGNLNALSAAGAPAGPALITALGPPLLPQLLSYSSYRLECALRSATLLGVFGLGGLGTELRLTLQSLNFKELWSGLWVLLAAMVLLETLLGWLRHRWSMPNRFTQNVMVSGGQGQELVALGAALIPLLLWIAQSQQIDPGALLRWQALPPMGPPHWAELAGLNWPSLVGNTILLTGLAAALAVGGAPLLLLLVAACPLGKLVVRGIWLLARLWHPPDSPVAVVCAQARRVHRCPGPGVPQRRHPGPFVAGVRRNGRQGS